MARLLVLKTAWLMDTVGNQHARIEISGIKFAVPQICLRDHRPRDPGPRRRRRLATTSRWRSMYAQTAHTATRRRPRRGAQALADATGAPAPARAACPRLNAGHRRLPGAATASRRLPVVLSGRPQPAAKTTASRRKEHSAAGVLRSREAVAQTRRAAISLWDRPRGRAPACRSQRSRARQSLRHPRSRRWSLLQRSWFVRQPHAEGAASQRRTRRGLVLRSASLQRDSRRLASVWPLTARARGQAGSTGGRRRSPGVLSLGLPPRA